MLNIVIVDYGGGNLRSVQKAFAHVGFDAPVTGDPERVRTADGVVLPGVGAFGKAMEHLEEQGLAHSIREHVQAGKPFAGICVGLQLLFERSEERFDGAAGNEPAEQAGEPRGFGFLDGRVRRFPATVRVPQIGWNQLALKRPEPLFRGVPDGAFVYFLHSYYADPTDRSVVAANCDYALEYCAALQRENIVAVQFHPEKSGRVGLQILQNLGEWMRRCS